MSAGEQRSDILHQGVSFSVDLKAWSQGCTGKLYLAIPSATSL
jgi:hypothetical protein